MNDHSSDPTGYKRSEASELQCWCVEFRDRLRAMVQVRLSPRLAGRLDPSDVVQEAFAEATHRYADYCLERSMSPYLWLRFLTLQRLKILHRQHLQTRKRSVEREAAQPELEVSSVVLAQWLIDSGTSPSKSAIKHEQQRQLHEMLNTMSPLDREILVLRHFEQLSTAEAAQVLEIMPAAAHRRYYRALERLREILEPIIGDGQAY